MIICVLPTAVVVLLALVVRVGLDSAERTIAAFVKDKRVHLVWDLVDAFSFPTWCAAVDLGTYAARARAVLGPHY